MNDLVNWQPSAPITNLVKRAVIIGQIRRFFNERGLLEVETPTISQTTVTDIHLIPFQTKKVSLGTKRNISLYLITSPEYHMKRLLACGIGPIFQLCHSFRNEEVGRYHNPEFTMLEWYRPYYNMYQMMYEVEDLLLNILNYDSVETLSYQDVFNRYVGIDPLSANKNVLYDILVNKYDLNEASSIKDDRDTMLQLLFATAIVPNIKHNKLTFIYHFPASQAALAELNTEDHRVADRFEVYLNGIELANGFRELTNADEQRRRFEQENCKRVVMNLAKQPIDENLLAALKHGMPECSGVALGVDRLIMLAINANHLSDVVTFLIDRA